MILREIATHHLEKCYSINAITIDSHEYIVVAAEKVNKCLLFDQSGTLVDTIWEEPGGTMSIVPLPGLNGAFLASQQMYSPNDSEKAKIVLVEGRPGGPWTIMPYLQIPFIHRFDLLKTPQRTYFIGATIKDGHQYKDDWSKPGKIWVGELGDDPRTPPILDEYLSGLTRNHGFFTCSGPDGDHAVISADEGVFAIFPPKEPGGKWSHTQLLDTPISDILFVDFDGDGEDEMLAISPFHGEHVSIYKIIDGRYQQIYHHHAPLPFAHALCSVTVAGKHVAFLGHRKGDSRDLYAITWDKGKYHFDRMLTDVGSTNLFGYSKDGEQYLVSANREIDQVGFYRIER